MRDFKDRKYIRDYVSDASAYDKIVEVYEKKGEDPLFIFEVTMQNHGGYTGEYEDFSSDIVAEDLNNAAINQYLSLIKVSDAEFEKLIGYFSKVEEDTVILFFGDHQPNDSIANPILRLNGVNTKHLTEEQIALRYQVPYVLWANFDIQEATGKDTDISFLAAEMLQTIRLPLNAYQTFLLEYDSSDASYQKNYQMLQYYFMFDYGNE